MKELNMNVSNKVGKVILSLLLLVMMVCTTSTVSNVNAQAGEGVDVCTWYSANGFKSQAQCQKWYKFKQQPYIKANQTKIKKCAVKSSITAAVPTITALLVGNPAAAAATYGNAFMVCMFGY